MDKSTHLNPGNLKPATNGVSAGEHPIATWFSRFEADKAGTSIGQLCQYVVNERDHSGDWSPELSELMTRATRYLAFGVAQRWVRIDKVSSR